MPDPADPTPVRVVKRGGKFVVVDRAGKPVPGQETSSDSAAASGAAARINESWKRAKSERRSRGAPEVTREALAEAIDALGFEYGRVRRKFWNPAEHPRARGKFAMSLSGEHHGEIGHPHGTFHYGLRVVKRQDLADKFAAGKFTEADADAADKALRKVALTGKGDYGNSGFTGGEVRSLNAGYAQSALRALHDNKPARWGGVVHELPAPAWAKRERRASRLDEALARLEESLLRDLPGHRFDPMKHPRQRGGMFGLSGRRNEGARPHVPGERERLGFVRSREELKVASGEIDKLIRAADKKQGLLQPLPGRKNEGSFDLNAIRAGDRVTIRTPHGQERTGRAVMRGPAGWVLNLGGKHGTPGIADERNIVRHRKRK